MIRLEEARGERGAGTEESTLRVSVVVPARNPGPRLQHLLAALERQTLRPDEFEVLVVDDGSTDGTIDAVETSDRLRTLRQPPRNQYAAGNTGAAAARAPVLAFTDGDCVPAPDWLESGLAALESADLIAGHIARELPGRVTLWTLLDVDLFLDQRAAVADGFAVGANMMVRRALFEQVGGYDDTSGSGGDYDLAARCRAAGGRLLFAPDAVVVHPTLDDARRVLRKVWRVNEGYARRESTHGRRPARLRLRAWIPFLQPLYGRLRFRHSLGLDGRRLAANGLRPAARHHAGAVVFFYVAQPAIANVAQLVGWFRGRPTRVR